MVYASSFGTHASTILLKYIVQWIRTSRILTRERPHAVFVMTPPLFAAMPAFWYAWRHGARVVLDAHTGAFLHRRWRHFQWLQIAMCRRAMTTLVHNEHIARIVRDAGGHATLVPDVPIVFAECQHYPRSREFTVAVACSFNEDEPIGEILTAAATLPDVQFLITGDPKYMEQRFVHRVPANVRLTGFLKAAEYGALLNDADVVMALTTRDHTMLRGGYEAIYQGTPVIVSDWPLLRAAFPEGAVHVHNCAKAIAGGIRLVQMRQQFYRTGALRLRDAKVAAWQKTRTAIVRRLDGLPDVSYA